MNSQMITCMMSLPQLQINMMRYYNLFCLISFYQSKTKALRAANLESKDTPIFEASDEDDSSSSDSEEGKNKGGGDLADQFVIVDKDGENKPLSPQEIKKLKRKTKLEKAAALAALALEEKERMTKFQEPKREKILTFRDMSHLSYFGGGGIHQSNKPVNNLITSTDIAKEIIEDLLSIVFGEEEVIQKEGETASDFIIDSNFEQLRKKVFVKEKIVPTKKIVPKKNGGASTFKKSNLSTAAHDSVESNITVEESKLTAFLESDP